MNNICHNCGLPEGALRNVGQTISITAATEFGDKRTRKHSVWCCTDECAVQALAISKYGKSSFRWPITLAQFRAMNPLKEVSPVTAKRSRASRKVKDLIWGASETLPTAKSSDLSSLESTG